MEGYEIPIGVDLSAMHEAIAKINQAITQMGAQISAALGSSNAALSNSENGMRRVSGTATTVAAANNQLAASVASASAKMNAAISTAANLGTAMTGLQSGIMLASRASRILTGVNLGTALQGWISRAGGIRAAFSRIPATLTALASNPVFRRIAVGAGIAIAGIIALRAATRGIGAAFRTMGTAAAGIFRGMRATAAAAARAIGGAFQGIASLPGKIFGSIPGVGGLLGAAGAIALLATQLKGASSAAAIFEDLTVSVEHFTGSAQKAATLLSDLASFALVTPFDTIDVQQTAGGLLGAGIREDVAGITKDLAAISANGQELRELGDAMGKGFAKGKFQTEELNKFVERNINLHPALQAQLGLTGEAYQKAIEKGLSFATVTAAIRSMSREGGQLFGLLERRSETFGGKVSTLTSAWTDLQQAFGKPFNDSLKPILQAAIDGITSLMEKARTLGERVGRAITLAFVAFKEGKIGDVFSASLGLGVAVAMDALMRGLRGAAAFLATALPPIFDSLGAKFTDPQFWAGMENMMKSMGTTIAAEIKAAFPDPLGGNAKEVADMKSLSKLQGGVGKLQIGMAGNGDSLADTMKRAFIDAGLAAKDAALAGGISAEVTAARAALQKLSDRYSEAADKIQQATAKATALKEGEGTGTSENVNDKVTAVIKDKLGTLTTSLGAVGGGGFGISFPGLIAVGRETNRHLKSMDKKMRPSSQAPSHVLGS